MKLPKHKCGLYLEHNSHKDYHESAAEAVQSDCLKDYFRDDEYKARAVDLDSIWTLQWYPNTPIGFIKVAAPSLEELLSFALEIEAEDTDARQAKEKV